MVQLLIATNDSDLLIEAADIIFSCVRTDNRLRDFLDQTFRDLFKQRKAVKPGKSCWQSFFLKLSKHLKSGLLESPAIATTNFDDLVARLIQCHIRCWNLASWSGAPTSAEDDQDLLKAIGRRGPRPIPAHLRGIESINHLEELRSEGLIGGKDIAVYHLHGWWGKEETLVFDAIGYGTSPKIITSKIRNWLMDKNCIVLFIGVGEGMFDRRFGKLWEDTDGWQNNYWLVDKKAPFVSRARRLGAVPNRLQFVEAGFETQASTMCDALESWASKMKKRASKMKS